MKTYQKLSLVLALGFSAAANSSVTPVVLYDSFSNPVAGEQGIPPGWIANAFSTGTNLLGYNVGNITLQLHGSIDGNIQGIVLQLFSDSGSGVPGTTAIGHAFVNPISVTTTPNPNVFTPNTLDESLVLSANTTYWARIDALAQGAANVNWSYSASGVDSVSGLGLWAFDTLGGDDFSAFKGDTGPFLMKVQANAILPPAAIPVPAAAWLMGSGLIGLVSSWRRKKVA